MAIFSSLLSALPKRRLVALLGLGLLPSAASWAQTTNSGTDKFAQLETVLPTPNSYRTASGAPGKDYWQQRADYDIKVSLDDAKQAITGRETITYTNRSPDTLPYLWVQLDQNVLAKNSITATTEVSQLQDKMSFAALDALLSDFDGGFKIESVTGKDGKALKTVTNYTMMRVDLPSPLRPGQSFAFNVKWHYNVNGKQPRRNGYEYFPEDKNYLYEIAQWYPRMAVYSDNQGWQHKQFLGSGEFTLPFGDYKVSITAPADHIVGATGTLQNASQVLTTTQQKRFEQAKTAKKPVLIVSQEEAVKAEGKRATGTKTWTFAAKNVRDFAWVSSRKFIWDAMQIKQEGKPVMCMSYYPKEGNPLWGKYSTEVVAHTIKTYSKHTIPYEYPVAISVHGPIFGMEYPMICFNGGRPEKDGTYSAQTKYAMIGVIIHEVGHNFFPMIVNSDERQWSWMDEGLNSFMQYLTEQEWERNYPSRRGEPANIVEYMRTDKSLQTPIMTNSESVLQFGNNAYAKPATALNILRETVMGRELFDHAFKTYAQRWAYKHPTPADFFRTMEDASAVDLDWFWRGWFYTTDHTDIALESVKAYNVNTKNPAVENQRLQQLQASAPASISAQRNATELKSTLVDEKPELKDFYNQYNPLAVTPADQQRYTSYLGSLSEEQRQRLGDNQHFYELSLRNVGGLVMPVIVQLTYADNSQEIQTIPAEIWRKNNAQVSKVIVTKKPVISFVLDPFQQTADTDLSNNAFPRQPAASRFELFQQQQQAQPNPMQQAAPKANGQKPESSMGGTK
ncbi:M1 family metallopeptidase [Hymenobacter sp. BT770]|uniref:M1 family metallopeptidase n=1 Tax=Hymenobacter sp. BT770 TaxID=2886942 RepID=UPI001D0FB16F|nr:M1 family metallopeptidase [Hymenobacter sp. BT770]MCC3153299.1 M1 family metallopeptidase [Hymenobacter sp. BT770]MDO3414294.1 M1 family metallopeptidase [Hymenobacter sp. BT770]